MQPAGFEAAGDIDAEMVAVARGIIKQRTGAFDPSKYTDFVQNRLPALGFTVPYALSSVVLTACGPLVVALVR